MQQQTRSAETLLLYVGIFCGTAAFPYTVIHAQLSFDPAGAPINTPVKGKPFIATKVVHSRRVLADGTLATQEVELDEARGTDGHFVVESHIDLPSAPGQPPRATFVAVEVVDLEARTSLKWTSTSTVALRSRLPEGQPVGTKEATSNTAAAPQPEMIGHRIIHGMLTTGHRIEQAVPAGMMGNTAPFLTRHEWWTNDELGLVVLEFSSDPVRGERSTELIDLKRIEPEQTRFQLPPGYSVRDALRMDLGGAPLAP